MKAYIVSAGNYSDYHIINVFLDKDKAYLYAKKDSDYEVEEYDIYDDKLNIEELKEEYVYIRVMINHGVYNRRDKVYVDIIPVDRPNEFGGNKINICIKTKLKDVPSNEQEENRFVKIAQDKLAECKSLYDIEGWCYGKINTWLNK